MIGEDEMAIKDRSLEMGSRRPVDIDVVGLYDELAPPWKLCSPDATDPVWSRAIFAGGKHHTVAGVGRPRRNVEQTA
jgi:hypothetical protein